MLTHRARLRPHLDVGRPHRRSSTRARFSVGVAKIVANSSPRNWALPQPLPPVSVIGVHFLFEPDVLVELEAYAELD